MSRTLDINRNNKKIMNKYSKINNCSQDKYYKLIYL